MPPDKAHSKGAIYLIPLGAVETDMIAELAAALERRLGFPFALGQSIGDLGFAYDRGRGQYLASDILLRVKQNAPADAIRALGVAGVDLFAPRLNFVFGQALKGGEAAIISVHRLDPLHYGRPADGALFRERVLKESIHELGHTFGLEHCRNPDCVMFFSNSLQDTDCKGSQFCTCCNSLLTGK
jgi:archaemetzincin